MGTFPKVESSVLFSRDKSWVCVCVCVCGERCRWEDWGLVYGNGSMWLCLVQSEPGFPPGTLCREKGRDLSRPQHIHTRLDKCGSPSNVLSFSLTHTHTRTHSVSIIHAVCGAGQGCLARYPFVFHATWLVCLFTLKLMWWVCVYMYSRHRPLYVCVCVWECVSVRRWGSDTSPLRLIESFRRENRLLKRKHKTLLPCYNKPVKGKQTTHSHTHTHKTHTHTRLSNIRAIGLCVCVCVCVWKRACCGMLKYPKH